MLSLSQVAKVRPSGESAMAPSDKPLRASTGRESDHSSPCPSQISTGSVSSLRWSYGSCIPAARTEPSSLQASLPHVVGGQFCCLFALSYVVHLDAPTIVDCEKPSVRAPHVGVDISSTGAR